jgi:hypothetical protein
VGFTIFSRPLVVDARTVTYRRSISLLTTFAAPWREIPSCRPISEIVISADPEHIRMTLGALVGVPITYMLGVTLAVFALGMSRFGTALAIGTIAPLFGGFWVGGLGMMIHAGKADARV